MVGFLLGKPDEYLVGIDTGGTYTDAVLLDYHSRRVLANSKTLTTRDNLTRGITRALDGLSVERPERIKLVSVSSTLATNSIAEGKERREPVVKTAQEIYPRIAETTEIAIEFSERYEAADRSRLSTHLANDLSTLGEEVTARIELEDKLILAMLGSDYDLPDHAGAVAG